MRCLEEMRILEIMRLWDQGLSQREIATGVNCGKSTVNDIQHRCREAGLSYDEACGMTNEQIRLRLYPVKKELSPTKEPNWESVNAWLSVSKRRNLRFAWEEYRIGAPDGLGYSQYCKRYRQWQQRTGKQVTMVQTHEPGKELFVDWMGDTLDCVCDAMTGELATAHFFVAVLGCSCYPYVEAFPNENQNSWLQAHVNAFEHIGGVPRIVVPDNCKTAVSKPNYYDPQFNPSYSELAKHYGVAVLPARVKKPKDKSLVEGSVGWLETWLLEWLRGQQFFSFEELNRAIQRRVETLSHRPFQQRPGSRESVFVELDKPALRPLPHTRFVQATYVTRRVPDNYHVEYENFYYSVPHALFKQDVTIRATSSTIEIINANRERVALHRRRFSGTRYVSEPAHMPEKHRRQMENNRRTGRDYLQWAATIGPQTRAVIERMLKAQDIEETAYRACMGVLQCAKKFGKDQLEAACARALRIGSVSYTTVRTMLQNPQKPKPEPLPDHENLRNPAEFG